MNSRREARPARCGSRASRAAAVAVLGGVLSLLCGSVIVWGAFTSGATSAGNEVQAAPDWVAPTAASSTIQKAEGGTPGYIRQGGAYRVYASVADAGNPASGVASVTGNVSAITSGVGATALSSGSFTIAGQTYGYRSASLTAGAVLSAGAHTYSLTSADSSGNGRTQTGFSVVVDNTVPSASDVQSANKAGGIAGRPEIGDTITFSFSEPVDPNSVLAGWSGSATSVVVHIDNLIFGNNDGLSVYNAVNTAVLPFGSVNLERADYVSGDSTFGKTGTASTMVQSGNAITITLGTIAGPPTTAGGTGTMVWSPSAAATDRAGNAESTAPRTESGTVDKDF
jgi:hypothetical protein